MPHGDGSGPYGAGPMSGRAMGFCAGYGRAGSAAARGSGAGFGRGMGRMRRGRRRGMMYDSAPYAYPAEPDAAGEKKFLESEAAALAKDMEAIQARIKELDTGAQG